DRGDAGPARTGAESQDALNRRGGRHVGAAEPRVGRARGGPGGAAAPVEPGPAGVGGTAAVERSIAEGERGPAAAGGTAADRDQASAGGGPRFALGVDHSRTGRPAPAEGGGGGAGRAGGAAGADRPALRFSGDGGGITAPARGGD